MKTLTMHKLVILLTAVFTWQPLIAAEGKKQTSPFTLSQAIKTALANNHDLQLNRIQKQLATLSIDATKALYDKITYAKANYTFDRSEPAVNVFGTLNKTTNIEVGGQLILPSGTEASIAWQTQRLSSNSTFAVINPNYDSSIKFALSQPLLKNFLGRNQRLRTKKSKVEYEAVKLELEDQIETIVGEVVQRYWQTSYHQHRLEYNKEALRWAISLLDSNRKKQRLGLSEASDILSAEANAKQREQDVVSAQRDLQTSLTQLSQICSVTEAVNAVEPLVASELIKPSELQNAREHAFNKRRELKYLGIRLDNAQLDVNIAKNERLPQVDLDAALTLNGLEGDFSGSQDELFSTDNHTYFIGGSVTYNWDNTNVRLDQRRAELLRQQLSVEIARSKQMIGYEIDLGLIEIEHRNTLHTKSLEIVSLQTQKLSEEEKRLRQGRSDTVELVRNQNDLIQAQQVELANRLNLRLAYENLLRLQSELLNYYLGRFGSGQ